MRKLEVSYSYYMRPVTGFGSVGSELRLLIRGMLRFVISYDDQHTGNYDGIG